MAVHKEKFHFECFDYEKFVFEYGKIKYSKHVFSIISGVSLTTIHNILNRSLENMTIETLRRLEKALKIEKGGLLK